MRYIRGILWGVLIVQVSVISLLGILYIKSEYFYFSQEGRNKEIKEMYKRIVAKSGQVQDALPLVIVDLDIVNAYNDGNKVVVYTGLINNANSDDEIALVLGHEIAHGMLGHLGKLATNDSNEISVMEANADKMGAVYAMKAGYDVCKGREIWKRLENEGGNYLGQDHPDYAYRYSELNMQCE